MNATLTSPELTRADRCDRCGAAARVRAKLPSGAEVDFFNTHLHAEGGDLNAIRGQVASERELQNPPEKLKPLQVGFIDLPRWLAATEARRWAVRASFAALVLAVYPTFWTMTNVAAWKTPAHRFEASSFPPAPATREDRVAYRRMTPQLLNEPFLVEGSVSVPEFLEFATEIHDVGRLERPDEGLDPRIHGRHQAGPSHELDRFSLGMIAAERDAARQTGEPAVDREHDGQHAEECSERDPVQRGDLEAKQLLSHGDAPGCARSVRVDRWSRG
jgi:hypothetical protein